MFHNYNVESFISENCSMCGIELTDIEDILVSVELDQYICQDCCTYHNIRAVKCIDLD